MGWFGGTNDTVKGTIVVRVTVLERPRIVFTLDPVQQGRVWMVAVADVEYDNLPEDVDQIMNHVMLGAMAAIADMMPSLVHDELKVGLEVSPGGDPEFVAEGRATYRAAEWEKFRGLVRGGSL